MKGIAHFASGVAVASCFPDAVSAAAAGGPLYFILGGVFGLLPDTIDFRFSRFFYRHDMEVAPDPNKPDARMIADAVAFAVNRVAETGKAVVIKLDTIRLGADLWQQYEVKFDVPARQVVVAYGPKVDTGGNPVDDEEPAPDRKASAPLACGVKLDYLAATKVDIFDGPLFRMEPTDDGRVVPRFIPWHREWSHSFLAGLFFGLLSGVIWGPLAGVVVLAAYAAHILVDQAGFMGSRLFFPFGKGRIGGLKWTHSGEALPNFGAVWLACLVIFWNLSRPMAAASGLDFYTLKALFYGLLAPACLLLFARRMLGEGAG